MSNTPDTPAPEVEQPQPVEMTPPTESPASAPQQEVTPQRRRSSFLGLAIDAILVILTIGILGFCAYYLKQQADLYHVPTPLEQALEEQATLRTRATELAKVKAPLVSRGRLAAEIKALEERKEALEQEIRDLRAAIEQHKDKLENERAAVLAAQHDIRSADKEARSVAKDLLPGLVIAKLTTRSGKEYPYAKIIRIRDGKIVITYPSGSAGILLNDIDMNSLPDIARYAFNRLDLVDMSDFVKGKVPPEALKKAKAKSASRTTQPKRTGITIEYAPTNGTPTLDTDSGRTSTTTDPSAGVEEAVPADGAPWEAPIDALPL
ncbi:MAG: hypothetical protein ACI4OX_10070 [Akkermansia sp.]